MKTLILLRHGEAASNPGGADFERELTATGKAQARSIADQLSKKGLWPDVVLCSAAKRTRETCEEILSAWEGTRVPDVTVMREIYGADVITLLKLINTQSEEHMSLLLIGHNPVIHQCVQLFSAEGELKKEPSLLSSYSPASCTVLNFNVDSWSGIAPRAGLLLDYLKPA